MQSDDVFPALNATCGYQWNIAFVTSAFEKFAHLGNNVFKIEACIVQVTDSGSAQVTSSQFWVFNDYRIRQAAAFFPFFYQQLYATRIRQNRDQCSCRVIFGQIGQIQWQTRTYYQRIDFGLQRGFDEFGVSTHGLHDVDGNQSTALGNLACTVNFPSQGGHVGGIDLDFCGRNVFCFGFFQRSGFFH